MASSPTTSWQIEGEKVQAVTDFIFLDSKITADGDSNQRTLAPWKESYENLDSILKRRDITLPTKVHVVKAMVFPVVMYDVRVGPKRRLISEKLCFELQCWRRFLRVLGLQGDQTSQSEKNSNLNIHWKD